MDCTKQISLIHNGIVENYQELKAELLAQKHIFLSQTDSEVIVHLIEEYAKTNKFSDAVRLAFNLLKGLSAILVVNAVSHEIIAAKNGSPLVVGIGDNEYFIASDAAGIVKHTKKVIFVKDHEMVILGNDLQLFSLPEGTSITPEIETIDWDIED